jgi:hypothetical protein
MRVAIAISALVHVALFVAIQLQPERPVPVTRSAPPTVTVEVVARAPEEPLTVALLEDHSVPTPALDPGPVHHTRPAPGKRRQQTAALAVTATTPTTTLVPEAQKPTHSSLMVMRKPETDVVKGTSSDFLAKLLENTKPLTDPQAKYSVAKGKIGSQEWIDRVSADELNAARGEVFAMNDAKRNAELKPDGTGTKTERQTFKMKFNGDGTVKEIKDKANWQQKSLFRAEFDVTDAFMRQQGIDPYSSYKMKILEETREQRFEMGTQYRTQQLARSRQFMQKNLERLLASTASNAELKQGLFELWDDCAETGSEELIAGGRAAREQVMGYITSKFPATSADAYTSDELARLNKRRKSKLSFAPYGG